MLQIAEHLVSPGENLGGGGGLIKLLVADGLAVRGVEQAVIAEDDAQRQMAADKIPQVTFDLMRIYLVDDIADQNDERSLFAVRVEVQKGIIVPRLDQLRKAVERRVQKLIHLLHAPAGRYVRQNAIGERNHADGVALPEGHIAQQ